MISDAEWIRYCCQRANLMVLEVGDALAATGSTDPLTAARTLQDWGAKVVCLSAGVLGGLACYQQKACTWPAHPAPLKDDTGVFATFAGTLIGCCAENGKCDWRVLKRAVAVASAVAAECGKGYGPKRLLGLDRGDYTDRFNQLRRNGKF
jgi:fructose-1-phosphate kinase PfkB-like protein